MSQFAEEVQRTESFTDLFRSLTGAVERVIKGKRDVVQLTLLALLSEGHILLEDAPGVGKTTIGKALAASIDVPFGRVQFTPDLLPSDVVGVSIWNRKSDEFEFRPGPIFNGIVLADEVNRASPKTQSALLEAMAERQVTVDGTTRSLGQPFLVIATQNPLDHAGTYPLPESQLDRFLIKVSVGYPSRDAELEILDTHGDSGALASVTQVADTRHIQSMIRAVRSVHVPPAVRDYLLDVTEATRRHPALALGASPRASLALQRIAQARAAAAGRNYVTPDDVKALAPHVLPHRLVLTQANHLHGASTTDIVDEILRVVPAGAS
ncbi:MAG: MoxR family ATPase [Actinomycetota bacterium]